MKYSFFLGIALLILTLWGCDSRRLYDSYVTLPDSGWNKDSIAVFNVEINKPEEIYNLYLNIRNRTGYEYANVWLFVETQSPNGKVERDTIDCALTDNEGTKLGSGWGDIYHVRVPYKHHVRFPSKGNFKFSIKHGMRNLVIKDITDVGLRIEKIN